ncbi:lytic murein transglycosylase B [Halomonas vilamensis]|uniref:Lytic murein transglycosylase B n=1 Tax=Vreelandella vilamensis TaxID=531309 RepID=A0ABU1H709_9GAMM|nr:lytic murein transglycosylase B [Halomonas vilamensis]MDR5899661.1 lytic murein transglycosylase B [Halomonas vilamensis]
MKTASKQRAKRFVVSMTIAGWVVGVSAATNMAVAQGFDPRVNADTEALVEELVEQGLPAEWLTQTLERATLRQEVLDAMAGAAERRLEWHEYRDIFLTAQRIEEGVAFMRQHQKTLARAEAEYGVPPEVITAIIGVETYYGRYKGRHRVLDSLATLAFHHPQRGAFFRGELAAFLRIAHEQDVDPAELTGSYAGAMGFPQFIPTSYQAYAVDFDEDGQRDLWNNPVDAIGSVANYFAEHGWQAGAPIYQRADMSPKGDNDQMSTMFNQTSAPSYTLAQAQRAGLIPVGENAKAISSLQDMPIVPLRLTLEDGSQAYYLGGFNFYVITRYNHSHLYAMAVAELAEAIAQAHKTQQEGER